MSLFFNPLSEDSLEQRTLELFNELGWEMTHAYDEFEEGSSELGRGNASEVILFKRLNDALSGLNSGMQPEAIRDAVEEISRDRSRMSIVAANKEVYGLVKNGVDIEYRDKDTGEQKSDRVRVIDWDNPENNDFLVCSQLWITGEMHKRRPDIVGFVNGIPLLFIELKAPDCRLEAAYLDNLSDYKDTIPQIFWYNAFIILSNGSEARIGSTTSPWEHFSEWKKVASENEQGVISLETVIRGTCTPHRLFDLIENFCLYTNVPGGMIKILAKNHQYLGVTNAMTALSKIKERNGRLGVFWHTQGSGKSISMIFFAQKVLRKMQGNWTFVIVTDRKELDKQIYTNFESSGVITEASCHADSCSHLRDLLRGNHRYIFTLIHKFRTEEGEPHPVLSERSDIIVITDEAHRSQYDTLALNMRTALPNASFLAFTGTPLIAGEEQTKEVFGDYISVYDFKQSVEDGATVPLFYENRIPELCLTNTDLNDDMMRLLEDAELSEAQEDKLEREFAREYHLITRDDRQEAVGKDIAQHFSQRGFKGKAMVVCIDKATAIKMYDKVKKHWQLLIDELKGKIANTIDSDTLEEELAYLQETDMAVVISQSQGEIAEMKAKGVDLKPHRKRIVDEDLSKKFKDPDDPFRLVFVCGMWMTGFDAPSCSTIYLDKPMQNHTLMQTIARANRVFGEKVNGLIVDYVGVFRRLEKALAIYGTGGDGGRTPVLDKVKLIQSLDLSIAETKDFCEGAGFSLDEILEKNVFELIRAIDEALDCLVADGATQGNYKNHANEVQRFFKAILPDSRANQYTAICRLIKVLLRKIQHLSPTVQVEGIDKDIEKLLDDSISPNSYDINLIYDEYGCSQHFDLSKIDFDALRRRFAKGKKRTKVERLKRAIENKLNHMLALNKTRMNYYDRFKEMIDEYNAGSANIEEIYKRLLDLVKALNDEDGRAVKEGLSEEELALFDLLIKPDIDLTVKERTRVKTAARDLLAVLKKEKLVLDWRKQQKTRAGVRVAIKKTLARELPDNYDKPLFTKKTEQVFQHIYDSYYGAGASVYSGMA